MEQPAVARWVCPVCHAAVRDGGARLECSTCARQFNTVNGIPDFRVSIPSWIDVEQDTTLARELAESGLPLEGLVRTVYSRRPGWDQGRIELRTRQVLSGREKLHDDLRGWLKPVIHNSTFLDLGCGGGMLIAAACDLQPGLEVLGVDVSMTWLVVAQRYVRDRGGEPVLAAAMAEALPFAAGSIPAIVSLDVIEHVKNPDAYLAEIDRVLQVGGGVALSTPNRFSLTAEPHVFVWGVGWLPQKLQAAYVRKRSGKSYDDTVLMSSLKLSRRLRRLTRLRFKILIPSIPIANMTQFKREKRVFAALYNRVAGINLLRPLFLFIAPFFRVTGWKSA